jgi:hypothetical protein
MRLCDECGSDGPRCYAVCSLARPINRDCGALNCRGCEDCRDHDPRCECDRCESEVRR